MYDPAHYWLIATAWLGSPTVSRASYVRYYCVEADIPKWFSIFRNLFQLVHSLRSCNFWSFVLLCIAHVIPDQRHRSSYLLLRSDVCLMLCTPVLQLKVLFLYIVGQNKCACKVRKKSTLLLCSTVCWHGADEVMWLHVVSGAPPPLAGIRIAS